MDTAILVLLSILTVGLVPLVLRDLVPGLMGRLVHGPRLRLESDLRIVEEQTTKVFRDAEEYYIPLIDLSSTIKSSFSVGQNQQPSEEHSQLEFFRLAQWSFLRYKWATEGASVLTLRDHTGEVLLVSLLRAVVSNIFSGSMGIKDYHALTHFLKSDLEAREFFSEFVARLHVEPVSTLFEHFKVRLKELSQEERATLSTQLECLCEVFTYEVNRFYDAWYSARVIKPRVEVVQLIEAELTALKNAGQLESEHLIAYLERVGPTEKRLSWLPSLWGYNQRLLKRYRVS